MISSLPRFSLAICLVATSYNASEGHSVNQSMAVQFTSPGNRRQRSLKASPTALRHNTTCKLALQCHKESTRQGSTQNKFLLLATSTRPTRCSLVGRQNSDATAANTLSPGPPDALQEESRQLFLCLSSPCRLGCWPQLIQNCCQLVFREQIWHLPAGEDVIDILQERLILDLQQWRDYVTPSHSHGAQMHQIRSCAHCY